MDSDKQHPSWGKQGGAVDKDVAELLKKVDALKNDPQAMQKAGEGAKNAQTGNDKTASYGFSMSRQTGK